MSGARVWSISLAILAFWAVNAAAGAPSTKEIPNASGAEREASVAAAKKGGKVVVYGIPGVDVDKLFVIHTETLPT